MSRELVERLREPMTLGLSLKLGDMSADMQSQRQEAADLIERQDILIKEMAETLQNMALSLSNKDTEE